MRYDKANRKLERLTERARVAEGKLQELQQVNERLREVLDSTMHEIRRFSGELSKHCEDLNKAVERNGSNALITLSQTALFTSGLISARLAFTDIELNPHAIRKQHTLRSGVYKKFEKAKHILGRAAFDRRVRVRFDGHSRTEIDAIQAFDLLPFVLLDNAIKYSPSDQEVVIEFEDSDMTSFGQVAITSIGPKLPANERASIFGRSVRGSNVKGVAGHGDGLGLFLAKKLCEYHDLSIVALPAQDVRFVLNGTEYADFRVVISWGRNPRHL